MRWRAHRREHELEARALDVARDLQDRALSLARQDVDRRLEAMNELRDQITSERGEYLTRTNYDVRHETLIDRISILERARANLEGRMWVLGAVVIIVELGLRFFHVG